MFIIIIIIIIIIIVWYIRITDELRLLSVDATTPSSAKMYDDQKSYIRAPQGTWQQHRLAGRTGHT